MNFSLAPSELVKRIKEKITAKELETIGINQKTLSAWKMKSIFPRSDDLFRISQHIGVSMEWLLTGQKMYMDELFLTEDQQKRFVLSTRERELIENYKKLNEKEKNAVNQLAKTLSEN